MKLGEKLQRLRKQSGLSQEQLAGQLDVSRQAVSKWELNEAMPDTDNVVQLSRLFGVSCDYLLREEVDQRGAPLPAPGESHLDQRGWVHNATILSLTVCAVGLLLAIGGGLFKTSTGPAAIGLIIQLGGILVFELAVPRMGEVRTKARLTFYSIACWLVLFIPVPFLARMILMVFPHWPSREGWLLFWCAVLYLLLGGAVTAALAAVRRKMKRQGP